MSLRVVIFLVSSCIYSSLWAQDIKYKKAIDLIVLNENIKMKHICVSDELVSFEKLGKFFQAELEGSNFEITERFILNQFAENSIDKSLLKLNKRKHSKFQLFFTEEQDGFFFAELIKRRKGKFGEFYIGESKVFMFRSTNCGFSHIKNIVINNN